MKTQTSLSVLASGGQNISHTPDQSEFLLSVVCVPLETCRWTEWRKERNRKKCFIVFSNSTFRACFILSRFAKPHCPSCTGIYLDVIIKWLIEVIVWHLKMYECHCIMQQNNKHCSIYFKWRHTHSFQNITQNNLLYFKWIFEKVVQGKMFWFVYPFKCPNAPCIFVNLHCKVWLILWRSFNPSSS